MKCLSKTILIPYLLILFSIMSYSQDNIIDLNYEDILNQVSSSHYKQSHSFQLNVPTYGILAFDAERNNTINEDLALKNSGILSFDISDKSKSFIGTLTIGAGKIYISLMHENKFIGIWPVDKGVKNEYIYSVGFGRNKENPIQCIQDTSELSREMLKNWPKLAEQREIISSGEKLKTFKMAIICTGEFYQANGGNSNAVNALITALLNAWNVILKKDLSIRLTLSQSFLYTDKNTDPFIPNENGGNSRAIQAADAIAAKFGVNSYDIGHVLHNHNSSITSGWTTGGVAGLGVVCSNATPTGYIGPRKAAGWSGSANNNTNDFVQLAAHEIGHQFNMTHTFNGIGESCTDNIEETTAYEIGSGTTIMSYNGVCSADQNIPTSYALDNYFHSNSVERAISFIASTNCGTVTNTNNIPPVVKAGADYTIPKSTPFMLVGTASDVNNDLLTYCWEQYDEDGIGLITQGLIGNAAASNSLAPLFRSYPPTDSPVRFFPSKTYILSGKNTGVIFEPLPSVSRTMNFRLLVRDNNSAGGGVGWDNNKITVASGAGPFDITSHNASATLTSTGTETFTLKWNVANTEKAPINCLNTDIYYSKDGGKTFPFFLEKTPNDGEHTLPIPNFASAEGRFMVKASNNIFFDINNADIKVQSPCFPIGTSFTPATNYKYDYNKSSNPNLDLSLTPVYGKAITKFSGSIASTDWLSNLIYLDKNTNSCVVSGNSVRYDIHLFYVSVSGKYTFEFTGEWGLVMNYYINEYSEYDLCNNMFGTNVYKPVGETNLSIDKTITLDLIAGKRYYIRISSFSPTLPATLPASYNITIKTKPTGAVMFDNIPSPGNDYIYTFVAYNPTDQMIAAINQSSDFRELLDKFGLYYIKGICIAKKDTNALNSLIGDKITSIDSLIYDFSICGDFSSNIISLEIIEPICDFGNATISNIQCNHNGTTSDPSDDFISFSMLAQYGSFTDTFRLKNVDTNVIKPIFGKFGTESSFRLYNGSAGSGDIILFFSYKKGYCQDTISIDDPGICSDCSNEPMWINEFHYDNEGDDSNEFVEIFVPGSQPENIRKYYVELYDGSTGIPYAKKSLDSMTINQGNNGAYYVWEYTGIHDGGPDGIALVGECGDVMEFVSYGGDFTATSGTAKGQKSVNVGVSEIPLTPPNSSIQKIDNNWVYTVGFNTKGKENEEGPCNIINAGLAEVQCNNNSTSYDIVDDHLIFKCNPVGNQLKGKYKLTSSKTKISPETADFGINTNFSTESGTAGKGDISIKMISLDSTDCSIDFILTDPGSCSPDCKISDSNISQIKCNENGTNTITTDDYLWFYLEPTGFNLAGKYKVEVNKGTITPFSADFGVKTYYNLQPGSAGGGDVELTIKDFNSSSCILKNTIIDQGPCSPNATDELGAIKKQVTLYPNPANEVLYLDTENHGIRYYKIFNIVGSMVLSGKMDHQLDISRLSGSVYLIRFYDQNNVVVELQKFVKE